MEEQTITVIQQITISYNCEEAKKECLKKIQNEGTNWLAFNEGGICDNKLQYSAGKTPNIIIEE